MTIKLSRENDVLLDVRWAKAMGIRLNGEFGKCRRFVEEIDTESGYQNLLSLVLDEAETNGRHKRKRERVCIDLVEDYDGVKDPQCKVNRKADAEELNRMNEGHLCHMTGRRDKGKVAVKEEDTDGEYQRFSGSVLGKAKTKESSKSKRGNVYIDLVKNDPQCMVNHKAVAEELTRMEKGHLCHMTGRRDKGKVAVKEEDTDGEYQRFSGSVLGKAKTKESSKRKRGNVYIDLVENDPQCMVNHKAVAEELALMEKGHLCHMTGRRNKGKVFVKEEDTDGEYQHFSGSVLGKAKTKESSKRKRGNVYIDLVENDPQFMVNHKAVAEELTRMVKGRLCHFPGRRYNRVTENLIGKCGDQAQRREKDEGKNVIREDGGACEKTVTRSENVGLRQKLSQKNNRLIQYQDELVDRARPVEKYKEHMGAKFKGRNKVVKIEHRDENFHQGRRSNLVVRNHIERVDRELIKVGKGKSGISHQKAAFENYSVKNEPDNGVKTRLHTKEVRNGVGSFQTALGKDVVHTQRKLMKVGKGDRGISAFGNYSMKNEPNEGVRTRLRTKEVQSKIRTVKTSKWLATHKKDSKMITESNVDILPELEILDTAAITEGRILNPFDVANTYENVVNPHCPILDDFRMELLKVLNKPFDKEEYKQHREEIRIQSYFKHYPDLGNKLKVHRYKRNKCMTIVRGFFFWLQNVTREGAFKPWKDRECLAVEPGPP